MARSLLEAVVRDRAGNILVGAKVLVYENGTTTPVTDFFPSGSGGIAQGYFISNASGRVRGWTTNPRFVRLRVNSNAGAATYSNGDPAPFTEFDIDDVPIYENPDDEEVDDSALAGVIADLAVVQTTIDQLTTPGTFAARPAAGNAGAYYIASFPGTTITRLYRDTGTAWICVTDAYGIFNPLDYGADPTGTNDSRAAFVACFAAAVADLDTGLPYETGTVQGAIVEVTAGQYKLSSGITFTSNKKMLIRGVGGQAARTLAAPVIAFTTGGFVVQDGQAQGLVFERLAIVSADAPAITATSATITTNFGGIIRECLLRCTGNGVPALKLSNVFDCSVYNTTLRSVNTATPSVLIESTNTGVGGAFQGWMFRFHECLFEAGGIRWDMGGTTTTVPGVDCGIYDCITENFTANSALLHVRNTHATQSTTWQGIEIVNTDHYDNADPVDIVKLEALGTGALAGKVVHIRRCGVGGSGKFVRCLETGGGTAYAEFILVEGAQANSDQVSWGASIGSGFGTMFQESGSGWKYVSPATASAGAVLHTQRQGDTQDRSRWDADGKVLRGPGGATAPDVAFGMVTGTPEGALTSNIGGLAQRRDGAAGTAVYLKESGTGNTGWVPLPALNTIPALAGSNSWTGATNTFRALDLRPTASGAKALQVRASTTSPGNIQEWQDSSGTAGMVMLTSNVQQNAAGSSFIDWSRAQVFWLGNGGAVTETIKSAASQTVSLTEWTDNSNAVLSKVNKGGYFMTRKVAAPADADLASSELAFWLDDTVGATKAMFKAKDSGGTVRTGSVALT